MSIDGSIGFNFNINDRRAVGLNPKANIPVNLQPSIGFTNGVAAGQANSLWQDSRVFSGTTDLLHLTAGLEDSYNTPVSGVRIKAIAFVNTGVDPIVIGGGSTPLASWLSATGTLTLPPGAFACCGSPDAAGWVIAAGSADILQVTGVSGQTYQVALLLCNS